MARADKDDPNSGVRLYGPRRRCAIYHAEQWIAEQREQKDIEDLLIKKFKVSRHSAAGVYDEAWKLLISADDSSRKERFKAILRTIRALYVKAHDAGKLTVCANLIAQMRQMFDLERPFVEGGSSTTEKYAERSTDDLLYFAQNGEYPEESKKKERQPAISGPLDDLA